jgi:hypothetical protein
LWLFDMAKRNPDKDPGTSRGHARRPQASLDATVQARIGAQLRAMYDEVVNEGVPDRFADLIDKLETRPPRKD